MEESSSLVAQRLSGSPLEGHGYGQVGGEGVGDVVEGEQELRQQHDVHH